MQVTFAMLDILAKRLDGHATLDDLLREMSSAEGQETSRRFSELDGVDALQTGLVVVDDDGLRITEAGRSVLRAVEAFNKPSPETESPDGPQRGDDLIDADVRQKIFDLDLRPAPGDRPNPERSDEPDADPDVRRSKLEQHREDQPDPTSDQLTGELSNPGWQEPTTEKHLAPERPVVPSFPKREVSLVETSAHSAPRQPRKSSSIAPNLKRLGGILRGHLEQDAPPVRRGSGGGGIGGLVLALLALLVIIICAGTYIAIAQIKSLKSEISTLEKQLEPLKRQVAMSEQQDKARSDQKTAPATTPADRRPPAAETRPTSAALVLSPDEVRLIREYIKPSPVAGAAAAPISVGDPVTTGTIPLPSPLTDKIPKLLGARFTIRNGAIIILKRDSRQADAVLGPS